MDDTMKTIKTFNANDKNSDVSYTLPVISFPAFNVYKKQAQKVAEYINNLEVTEDNIKDVKKDIADARKIITALDTRRITIKKNILAPFNIFETQVKELSAIINDADTNVRTKVRQLEEKERDEKREKIKTIFNARMRSYTIDQYIEKPFERFITPQLLNKSVNMKKAEAAIVDWLESVQNAIDTIAKMQDHEEIMAYYVQSLDITKAISQYESVRIIKESMNHESEPFVVIRVKGLAEINFTKQLLDKNGIHYEIMKEGK